MSKQFRPFVAFRNSDFVRKPYLIAEPAVAFKLLHDNWTKECVDVMHVTEKLVSSDWTRHDAADQRKLALEFKRVALDKGATPEAIRLLGTLIPLTKKECSIMAEKLKAKATAKKTADSKGLKAAAKAAPVAKGAKEAAAAPKRRGNPEALKKAREARANKGPDTRKIKALKKVKELDARDGTFRRKMLEDLISSKTVQEFRDKNAKYDAGCLKYAIEAGVVSVA